MTELDRIEKDLNSIDKTLGRIANALEVLISMHDSFQDDLVELVEKESELGTAIGETPVKSSHGFNVGDRVIYENKPHTILNFDESGELCTLHSITENPNYFIGNVPVHMLEKDEK